VGKTEVAIKLARSLGTAVISADSRQCYREMNIGTAKPSANELQGVSHYFLDAFPVTQVLSAADFERLALTYLEEIFTGNNAAVVCGGTGLYIKALAEGLDEMPGIDEAIATQAEADYKQLGMGWLSKAVEQEDPEFYSSAETGNPARLLRALTFIRSNGKSINHYRSGTVKKRPFKMIKVGLELPRELLYERINQRVDGMMARGLLAEVEGLMAYKEFKSLQTVGYAELFDYLEGKCSLADAIGKIKQHTRNYAKRQLTWFKKDKEITWFDARDKQLVEKIMLL
jgi:tRNA dimethylallyltransferase